jgi:hypothetical protein
VAELEPEALLQTVFSESASELGQNHGARRNSGDRHSNKNFAKSFPQAVPEPSPGRAIWPIGAADSPIPKRWGRGPPRMRPWPLVGIGRRQTTSPTTWEEYGKRRFSWRIYLLSELIVQLGIKSQARLFGQNQVHDAFSVTSCRKACRWSPGRNLKNRDMDCRSTVGSSFSRFAPARKSAQIISRQ